MKNSPSIVTKPKHPKCVKNDLELADKIVAKGNSVLKYHIPGIGWVLKK